MLKSIVELLFPTGLIGCSDDEQDPSYSGSYKKKEEVEEKVEEEVKENLKDDSDDEEKLINSEDIN